MTQVFLFQKNELASYITKYFIKLGVPLEEAEISADVLLAADLRGIQSHGIIRLHTYYGNRLKNRTINPAAQLTTLNETPTTLRLDGGNSIGMVVSKTAMQRCIEKAALMGVSIVSVRNSNHFGIAGYYAMMALPQNMIGISLTNSQPLVAPTYSRKSILGTNPIAVAVPARNHHPYVLDMATSIVPIGKVTVYDEAGKDLPEGWGIDSTGQVTTSPSEVLKGGALMPLGGMDILGGYKGYGLSLMVDIFSSVLSGAASGTDVGDPSSKVPGANVGHFFAAININAFRPLDDFLKDMDHLLSQMKNAPKAEGADRIYIHGEKEFERVERNEKEGVPVLVETVQLLIKAGEDADLPFNLKPIRKTESEAY